MKKLILLLSISLLCTGFLSAERQFRPVLDGEIVRWSFIVESNMPPSFGNFSIRSFDNPSFELIAYGDTLINDIAYRRLFLELSFNPDDVDESDTNWQNHIPHLYHRWEHHFIRESEDASRLYLYNSFLDREFLLSDMNLQEGDIIAYWVPSAYINIRVHSVFFEDGLKHIVFQEFGSGWFPGFAFVEGVGPSTLSMLPYFNVLNCFQNQSIFHRNIRNYLFPNFPCGGYHRNVSVNEIFENEYFVFVSAGKIEVVFTSNVNVDIAIYNIQGNLQYVRGNASGRKFTISTSSFQSGVYVLRIFDRENQQTASKKIIIN